MLEASWKLTNIYTTRQTQAFLLNFPLKPKSIIFVPNKKKKKILASRHRSLPIKRALLSIPFSTSTQLINQLYISLKKYKNRKWLASPLHWCYGYACYSVFTLFMLWQRGLEGDQRGFTNSRFLLVICIHTCSRYKIYKIQMTFFMLMNWRFCLLILCAEYWSTIIDTSHES